MIEKIMGFHGIVNLKPSVVDQLRSYLLEKESQTALKIVEGMHPSLNDPSQPQLQHPPEARLKFTEAIEMLSKAIRQKTQSKLISTHPEDVRKAGNAISSLIWEYLEILDEFVIELFQQIDQVEVDQRPLEFVQSVEDVKEVLMHQLEDLGWVLARLEHLIGEYYWTVERRKSNWTIIKKAVLFWQTILDRSLFSHIEKSKKYLGFRYQNFSDRYQRYLQLQSKIDVSLDKFNGYPIFMSFEIDTREKFKKVYGLIKFWELNRKTRSLPQREVLRSLRHAFSSEKVLELFKSYYNAVKEALFSIGKEIKHFSDEQNASESKIIIKDTLTGYRNELHTLGATILKFREFVLRTDPNPYVRSRLGFPEWVVGPEPAQTKHMLELGYEVEKLDALVDSLHKSLDQPFPSLQAKQNVKKEIQAILHEMGQPLISKSMMKANAEKLVHLMQSLDELGSNDQEVVKFIGESLVKALKNDWKYHILFDISSFYQLYMIHQGLTGPVDERNHLNRMHKFKRLIQQISQWIKNNDTPRHAQEIELDINDMKAYLQDFMAQVQRVHKGTLDTVQMQESTTQLEQMLLEYCYLFGHFFHQLRDNILEERMIRNQFLFVDQYFESIENTLHDYQKNINQDLPNSST
jgi:hypothetical protein